MDQPEMKLTFKGEEYSLGLKVPDKIPVSFAEYPAQNVLDLDALKKIYSNPGRKHGLELYKRRKQQGRMSSCCPYAATTAQESKRAFDQKDDREFGPEYLYAMINGGRDEGAMLDDAMRYLVEKGCCLRDAVAYQVFNLNSMSMEQKRFAAQQAFEYRSLDWYKMPHGDLAQCWASTVSAIALRDPVLMAVHCGDGFFSCGPDGVCRPDKGVGNHAVCGVELEGVLTAKSLRDIKIWTVNSHGARFGKNGCYLHTYDHMAQPCQYHQHCACRSMRTSPDEHITTLLA
jgi:hypothetical protein